MSDKIDVIETMTILIDNGKLKKARRIGEDLLPENTMNNDANFWLLYGISVMPTKDEDLLKRIIAKLKKSTNYTSEIWKKWLLYEALFAIRNNNLYAAEFFLKRVIILCGDVKDKDPTVVMAFGKIAYYRKEYSKSSRLFQKALSLWEDTSATNRYFSEENRLFLLKSITACHIDNYDRTKLANQIIGIDEPSDSSCLIRFRAWIIERMGHTGNLLDDKLFGVS